MRPLNANARRHTHIALICLGFALQHCGATAGSLTNANNASTSSVVAGSKSNGGIQLASAPGMCIDVKWANKASGAAVQLFTCNGTDAQTWTPTGNALQVFGNMCLDVPNGTMSDGTEVQTANCTGDINQQWSVQGSQIVWNNKYCLAAPGGTGASGTRLVIATCTGDASQQWNIGAGSQTTQGQQPTADSNQTAANQTPTTTQNSWGQQPTTTTTQAPTAQQPTAQPTTTTQQPTATNQAPTQQPTTTSNKTPTQTPTTTQAPTTTANTTGQTASGSCVAVTANWPQSNEDFENQVLQLVNQARAQGKTCLGGQTFPPQPALTRDPRLDCSARAHAADMSANNYFDHNSLNGENPFQRMTDAGYTWSNAGENIAKGQTTPQQVVTDWLSDQGHCVNIMGNFTNIGIGYDNGYWVQDFGSP